MVGRRYRSRPGPREQAVRRILGFAMILFAFGMLFGMLIAYRFLRWILAVLLIGLGIWFNLQGE